MSNWVSVQNLPPRIFFHPEGSDLRAFDDYARVPLTETAICRLRECCRKEGSRIRGQTD